MARYRGRYRHSSGRAHIGREIARQHIREAETLSAVLGGTDVTVKKYLFSIRGGRLQSLLREYGNRYGSDARSYAEQTLPAWRAGTTHMSGMVAERFYKLLPPRMPMDQKFAIAEELWHFVGPSSERALRFGPENTQAVVLEHARSHIDQVVTEYRIPASLTTRFEWLSSGDVEVKEQILNYLRELDKTLVMNAATANIPVIFESYFGPDADVVENYSHTLTVGKHKLVLIPDRDKEGISFESVPRPSYRFSSSVKGDKDWIWWVVGIAVVVAIFALGNQ